LAAPVLPARQARLFFFLSAGAGGSSKRHGPASQNGVQLALRRITLRLLSDELLEISLAGRISASLAKSAEGLRPHRGEQAHPASSRKSHPMLSGTRRRRASRAACPAPAADGGRTRIPRTLIHIRECLAHLGECLCFCGPKNTTGAKEIFEATRRSGAESDAPKRKLNAVLRKLGHDVSEEPPAPAEKEEEGLCLSRLARPVLQIPREAEPRK